MLIARRLRLITPLLAAKRSNTPGDVRRVFRHLSSVPKGEEEGRVYIYNDLGRWEWAFLEARDALRLDDVAVSAILPSYWYSARRTSTYNRTFHRGGTPCVEKFESLMGGQVFSLRFTLSKHVPPNTDGNGRFTRPPDEEEFDAMLSHIGEELGMSEWGHARKFGRFAIQTDHADGDDPPSSAGGEPVAESQQFKNLSEEE